MQRFPCCYLSRRMAQRIGSTTCESSHLSTVIARGAIPKAPHIYFHAGLLSAVERYSRRLLPSPPRGIEITRDDLTCGQPGRTLWITRLITRSMKFRKKKCIIRMADGVSLRLVAPQKSFAYLVSGEVPISCNGFCAFLGSLKRLVLRFRAIDSH